MQKKLVIIILILIMVGGIIGKSWDIIYTKLEHTYYELMYGHPKTTGSIVVKDSLKATHLGGIVRTAYVYLPAAYKQQSSRKFPVLYLLHGYPGSNSDWLINANLQIQLDKLIQKGTISPLIVVFPDGNGPVFRDSQYINATKLHQNMEDYLISDVVTFIDQKYRTKKGAHFRAIGGLSSGAYGAMNITLHHPDTFGAVLSHSGYFMNHEWGTGKLLNKKDYAYNNPLQYVSSTSVNSDTYMYMDIGNNDDKNYIQQNKEMATKLSEKNVHYELRFVLKGDHRWSLWRKQIIVSLTWLGQDPYFQSF